MKLLLPEFNIIIAALRRTEMAYDKKSSDAQRAGKPSEAVRQRNTAIICKEISQSWIKAQAEPIRYRRSEYNLVLNVLRATASAADYAASMNRQILKLEQANLETAFAAGCRAVIDKWERDGGHVRAGGVLEIDRTPISLN